MDATKKGVCEREEEEEESGGVMKFPISQRTITKHASCVCAGSGVTWRAY